MRREAGRSRRSEISKRLRVGWDEAGELSGVRSRVDGQGKKLREPAIDGSGWERRSIGMMSTFFSARCDAAAVSDLRAWSDEQLIAAAKNGPRAPFGELYERHMKRVSYVTRRITRNREDAEDAVQHCCLCALVH